MPELFITCPSTGEPFSRGINMSKEAFENSGMANKWNKEHVRLEDEQVN